MFTFLNKKITQLLLLPLLFSLSVFIRSDDLRSDLCRESEWQTGHVLSTLSIWENDGMKAHYFSPVWTFNTPADKFTNSLGGIKDRNNFTYYTSYPPFSFILPYAAFKLSGQKISVTSIRVFSLIIHFLSALLIFLMVKQLWNNVTPALIAFCIYVFSSGNLWFHGNFYFADSLVQFFVAGMLLSFIYVITAPKKNSRLKNMVLFLFTFFGVYTEWLALFVALFMVLFLILKLKSNKNYIGVIIGISCAAAFSLSLTIVQYSSIAGFSELKNHSISKYNSRNGFTEQTALNGISITQKKSFVDIYNNYIRHYNYPGLLVIIGFGLVLLWYFRKSDKAFRNHPSQILAGILLLSIIAHHLAFFNFTVIHDVSTLKISLLFSLFLAYISGYFNQYKLSVKNYVNAGSVLVIAGFISLSAYRYHLVNGTAGDIYYQEKIGKLIAEFNSPDEIVMTNIGVSPVMMWYARRNPIMVKDAEEGRKLLQSLKYNKGLFIKLNPADSGRFYELIRLGAKEQP